MNETRIAVIALIFGVLGISYGTFDYLQEADATATAPVQSTFESTEMFSLPVWLGGGALVAGILLLIVRPRG